MERAQESASCGSDTVVEDAYVGADTVIDDGIEATRQRIRQLPPEVGAVLLSVGVVGLIVPGPMGTPLILAGGIALIPSVFGRLETWIYRRFPKSHKVGMQYVDRFINDYEKRFPIAEDAAQS